MIHKGEYHQDRLRDYSSLFTRSEAMYYLKNDFNSINFKIERHDKKFLDSKNRLTYMDYLKHIYGVLESHYPIEYIYKNSLLNEWLIKEIGQDNSVVFNEFRLGKVVADLVMFNGISKVFEIKTKYDSDSRLEEQIKNYKKVFNQIYLIVPQSKIQFYSKYKDVGIVTYNNALDQRFTIERSSTSFMNIDPEIVMQTLHTKEYKNLVELFYNSLPNMTSFNQFDKCYELIKEIPKKELNELFIDQMKKRKIENVMSIRYFKELNQLSLALKLSKKERQNLLTNLNSQITA